MELENQITSILFYAAEQYSLFNQILLCECECLWNLKKKHVHHIYNDLVFMNYIDTYVKLCGEFSSSFDHPYIARSRVKNRLSIQQKIERYMFEKEDGKYPIIKCLNDLFGFRYIYKGETDVHEVVDILTRGGFPYKCIDASKNGYVAVHIYIEGTNREFPWEFQIWNEKDSSQNYSAHKIYKQDYTEWEYTQEGGVSL